MTGRQEGECCSRLAKHNFFDRFLSLSKKLPNILKIEPSQFPELSYGEVKQLSTNYQVTTFCFPLFFLKMSLFQLMLTSKARKCF